MVAGRSCYLALVLSLGLSAQAPFEARFTEIEQVLDRHYRQPRLEEARERSNRAIEAFNARSKTVNAELAEARVTMEKALAPGKAAYAELQKLDAELKASIPDWKDKEGNAKYATRIEARNALGRKVNELNAEGQRAVDAYNALTEKAKAELDLGREKVLADQASLNQRLGEYEKFVKSREDIAFFTRVNRLLAEIRMAAREKGDLPDLAGALTKVRAIRRELAAWAMAGQAMNPTGLVVVEVRVGDEPCWLIVDSGATETVLNQEVAEAAGLGGEQGEAVNLVVVGGMRLQGRRIPIPRLTVAGQTQANVSATAVRPTDVGIDGLLGQSFLKAYVYTIDERTPDKLILLRR